jgi:hypothetical protein
MSKGIEKDIICPHCEHSQKYTIYTYADSQKDIDLRQSILAETLFDWRCERCNYFAGMVYPIVFSNPENKYVVSLEPVGNMGNTNSINVPDGFLKRKVKNLAELKEKILILDAGYYDVAMELVKDALCAIIKSSYKVSRVHAYFSHENNDDLEFSVFLPGKKEPISHSTKVNVYQQSEDILSALSYKEENKFTLVNARLAKKILEDYADA